MIEQPASPSTLLSSIAAVLSAIAWPVVAVLFLTIYKAKIGALLEVLTKKIGAATKVKAWQLELDTTAQEIKDVVNNTAAASETDAQEGKIPDKQLRAALEVDRRLREAPLPEGTAVGVVQEQMEKLANEYDWIRSRMQSGQERTVAMSQVLAKMRALSLAARPALRSFMSGQSAGERLAAICILQIAPDFAYFRWLIERFKSENQAFVLAQAAVAVSELAKARKYQNKSEVAAGIEDALQRVSSYKGGAPDPNTIYVLKQALAEVN